MKKPLLEMMTTACSQETAVTRRLEGKLELVVYPMQKKPGLVVGLGYGREDAHRVNMPDILRRRTQDVARFGPWLPAVFDDGSCFLVMRAEHGEPDEGLAESLVNEIHTAKELLS